MALFYDFEIIALPPTPFGGRPGQIALFRDPRTAQALQDAQEGLRGYLEACGFGFAPVISGVPPGRFPAEDVEARAGLARALVRNAPQFRLPRPWDYPEVGDVFRLGEFLASFQTAMPIALDELEAMHRNPFTRAFLRTAYEPVEARWLM